MTGRRSQVTSRGPTLGRHLREFLLVRHVNRVVFKARFIYLMKVRRSKLRVCADETGVLAAGYSLSMLKHGRTSDRPLQLIRPLSALGCLTPEAKVLSVGCRFETELLYLIGHRCSTRNVRGLDTISYSPWVDAGNMHAMPYPDCTWDVVILGWVISYSDRPRQAAAEVIRVARDGATIAIGVSYYPRETLEDLERTGPYVGPQESRIQTVDALLDLFEGHVGEVFLRNDARRLDREGTCSVIFSVKKESVGLAPMEPVDRSVTNLPAV